MNRGNKKKINAVVIGASSESIYAIQKAKELGIFVIALDGNPNAEGLHFADESFVVDIRKHESIFCVLDKFSPDVVIPIPIGRYLTSIGAVNDHYNLCGITHEAAMLCTDKHSFHNTLFRENMRQVEHILISNGEIDIPFGIGTFIFPGIAKPRYGSGNRSVRIYWDENNLKDNFFSKLPYDEDFVFESFVEGTEYGIDAAIIDGVFYLILLREKLLTPYPYCQCVGYLSVIKNNNNIAFFNSIEIFFNKTGQILKLNNCLMHADIIRQKNNNVFPIEISARPSGHNLHNLFTIMATGVDMIFEYLKFALPQLNKDYCFVPHHTEHMLIRYFDLVEGRVVRVPDKEYLCNHYPIKAFECNIQEGMELCQITDGHSLMDRGYYIICGKDENELVAVSNEINKAFVLEKQDEKFFK